MNYQIKVLSGLDRGNYVILITRGPVDIPGFEQILDKIVDATRPLLDCKVLVDLQDSTFHFLPSDVADFFVRFDIEKWPHNNKIALVSAAEMEQYKHLTMLGERLVEMNLDVGFFYNVRDAITWLSNMRQ
ncbi:MAG TPA: hypothetical protein VHV54_08465 [Candidatus Binatia bacterium]|nr:hypothetical protein [Candidatus Binatia bacterium]